MRPLVIVRPQPGGDSSAAAARAIGLDVIVMPLFEVDPVEWRAPDAADFDALLLTSANAVRHGGNQLGGLRGLPAYCVGEATAAAARKRGFAIAAVGGSDLQSLLESVPAGLSLLHLCGVHRRQALEARQSIEAVAVYEAKALPAPEGLDRVEGAVVALHSPRAGAALASAADTAGVRRESIAIAAISQATAEAAGGDWGRVECAAEPSDAALLALASQLCNNPR